MIWLLICSYVISVVICVLSLRCMYRSGWMIEPGVVDILISIVPFVNLLAAIIAILIGLHNKGLPRWLYRLYGGK